MCGIAGWIDYDRNLEADRSTVEMMTETMSLRGPDAGGVWINGPAALGHRRLSVIDLVGGKQPMEAVENNETIACLTYSGEVYNFVELRDELKSYGHRFKSRSDTEVVLRGYLEWGDKVAEKLVGIFAFAIWDVRQRCLFLVRDRLGVKPLFYQPTDSGVLFGSEPKAILAHPGRTGTGRNQGSAEASYHYPRAGRSNVRGHVRGTTRLCHPRRHGRTRKKEILGARSPGTQRQPQGYDPENPHTSG